MSEQSDTTSKAAAGGDRAEQDAPAIPEDIQAMTFEQALAELEKIVARLESGDVALEDSIAFYERGALLKRYCDQKLRQAEARIEKLAVSGGTITGSEQVDPE